MPWNSSLELDYSLAPVGTPLGGNKTVAHFQHQGPLRILQSLYPQGQAICHNVLVHPPGGLAGGDTLDMHLGVAPNAHGLVTTPDATRFYKTDGEPALQRTGITFAAHSQHIPEWSGTRWKPSLSAVALLKPGLSYHRQTAPKRPAGTSLL